MKKKIICLIDSLDSGGAQRQIISLATYLAQEKYNVTICTYFRGNHYDAYLNNNKVEYKCILKTGLSRIYNIRKFLIQSRPNVVIAFLETPVLIAELASIPKKKWGLIVSERTTIPGNESIKRKAIRFLYKYVDSITTNSHSGRDDIIHRHKKWTAKTNVIYNSVDSSKFFRNEKIERRNNHYIVVASLKEQKNPFNLIEALNIIFKKMPDINIKISWYGHKNILPGNSSSMLYTNVVKRIRMYGLEGKIIFKDPVKNIEDIYNENEALILPSFFEGLPNVVCEAMACGLPILMSNVNDASLIIKNYDNGFLFDPHDPKDIAETIMLFTSLPQNKKTKMGMNNKVVANKLFNTESHINQYIKLINDCTKNC